MLFVDKWDAGFWQLFPFLLVIPISRCVKLLEELFPWNEGTVWRCIIRFNRNSAALRTFQASKPLDQVCVLFPMWMYSQLVSTILPTHHHHSTGSVTLVKRQSWRSLHENQEELFTKRQALDCRWNLLRGPYAFMHAETTASYWGVVYEIDWDRRHLLLAANGMKCVFANWNWWYAYVKGSLYW